MREILIKAKKGSRPLKFRSEFFEREVVSGLKGCPPGEWAVLMEEGNPSSGKLLVMANPLVRWGAPIRSLGPYKEGQSDPQKFLEQNLHRAIKKRRNFKSLSLGSRLVYGDADGLPGLIIDEYKNGVVVQINTAGIDKHREWIKDYLSSSLSKTVLLLDNPDYREGEGLPTYEEGDLIDLEVEENGLIFNISKDVLQKVGYYYDHRINRRKLQDWIQDYQKELINGVDLFSYAGSWGMNALKAGVKKVDFVDQGNFQETVQRNLQLNNLQDRGTFFREDVFQWIKDSKSTYDLVMCDPPAFSKSLKNKSKALGGYEKLHRGLSQIVHSGSLLAIGSCTHGIGHEELDQTVLKGFKDSPFELTLLDMGLQGVDHPISHLGDSGFYIKFLLYLVS